MFPRAAYDSAYEEERHQASRSRWKIRLTDICSSTWCATANQGRAEQRNESRKPAVATLSCGGHPHRPQQHSVTRWPAASFHTPGDGGSISATNWRKEGPGGSAYHEGRPWLRRWLLCVDGEPLCSQLGLRLRGGGGSLVRRRRSRLKQSVHGWAPTADFAGGVVVFQQSSPLPPWAASSPRAGYSAAPSAGSNPPWAGSLRCSRIRRRRARGCNVHAHEHDGGGGVAGGRGRRPCSAGASRAAGSLRRMPSWRAESARDASCRSCPIQRLCFYYRRGPVSCQRMTHVSCFEDMIWQNQFPSFWYCVIHSSMPPHEPVLGCCWPLIIWFILSVQFLGAHKRLFLECLSRNEAFVICE